MDGFKSPLTGSMTLPLFALIGLMALCLLFSTTLREPKALLTPGVKPKEETPASLEAVK
jgi:hypothetical protein